MARNFFKQDFLNKEINLLTSQQSMDEKGRDKHSDNLCLPNPCEPDDSCWPDCYPKCLKNPSDRKNNCDPSEDCYPKCLKSPSFINASKNNCDPSEDCYPKCLKSPSSIKGDNNNCDPSEDCYPKCLKSPSSSKP